MLGSVCEVMYDTTRLSLFTKFGERKNLPESLSLARVRLVPKFAGAGTFSALRIGRLIGLELRAMGEYDVIACHSHDLLDICLSSV